MVSHSQPAFPATTASLLADPPQQAHSVHFYEKPDTLFEHVARFLGGGLESGDRLIVIATAAHAGSITGRLDPSAVSAALAAKRLLLLDAHETLGNFMVGEEVDADLFHALLERLVADIRAGAPDARVRAYGEMVDVLWHSGRSSAALRLEELWGDASRRHDFTLLCAYAMGHFYGEADGARVLEVCDRHTHVIGSVHEPDAFGPLRAEETAAEETVEARLRALETELRHRKGLEVALRQALRDRSRVEAELRESVRRERDARRKAEENDAFKEQFIAVLGHDLRNPLNTILTTARLMIMRGELPAESSKRLDRVIASGVRMQHMIEQILDVTSDRLDDGIRVMLEPGQDVSAIATGVVEELRAVSPTRKIDVVVDGPCTTSVDGPRLGQVLRNLVGNAIVHGDQDKPVRLTIAARPQALTIEVHNFGPPIADEERALLFEPFKRSRKSKGRSDGLGVGLYISRRIVTAHGGTLDVDSSSDRGTTFRVTLPRERQ